MRLLFIGDLAASGFGTVTQDMGRALLAKGEDVRFLSQNELGELPEPFASRTFVVNEEREGWVRAEFSLGSVLDGTGWKDGWTPEAVLILADFYGARVGIFSDERAEAAFHAIPTFHYAPIEGVGLPPSWRVLWDIASPIAMSEFGAREIAKVTGTLPPVVYHGVDTSVFRPVDRAAARKMFGGIPDDAFVMLRTDRNMPRKRYPSMLRAIAPVMASHPKAVMLMHCRSSDEGGDLRDEVSKYPTDIARRVHNTGIHDRHGIGLSRDELNYLYNAADLYLSTSAEGFGLTIAESLAAGTPAVAMDYSSVPEVVGPAGLLVPYASLVDNEYSHQWAAVDEPAFGRAVARMIDNPKERLRLGKAGPAHIANTFSWTRAAEQMASIFAARIESRAAA